ncbi:hypothetical protein AMELA_G00002430 [Ameiurus melas]|uniref:Cyclin-dependent kinase inhibitor domain-containing protein n=1 Tax=Ameiurus melas TaxID=219545 RepID=A0A7J6BEB8_AMEME|nr:hypothetical protein AMELA_G00002430 [Ameiurus melas]
MQSDWERETLECLVTSGQYRACALRLRQALSTAGISSNRSSSRAHNFPEVDEEQPAHFWNNKAQIQCVMMSSPVCRGGVEGGVGGSARRCLFGSVDHEELQRDYTLLMRAELQDASRRWNFDFTVNKPRVGGDLEWVALPEARVPSLYHDCTVGPVPRQKGAGPVPKTPERCDGAEKHTLKRKQTNITDFYQAKRRVVTSRKSGQ